MKIYFTIVVQTLVLRNGQDYSKNLALLKQDICRSLLYIDTCTLMCSHVVPRQVCLFSTYLLGIHVYLSLFTVM